MKKIDDLMNKIYSSNNYGNFKIIREIEHNSHESRKIEIEFIDTKYRYIVALKDALRGVVRDPTRFMYEVKDKIFTSNYGNYKIIDYLGYNDSKKNKLVKIRFIDTGYECIVIYDHAKAGVVKDPTRFMYEVKDKIFMSNNCGEFIVLEETDNNYKSRGKRVNIKFLLTGSVVNAKWCKAKIGRVFDPAYNSVSEARKAVGATPILNIDNYLAVTLYNIKNRCYNENAINYINYGNAGITVSDDWNCSFEIFKYDAMNLPGWNLKFNDPSNYSIDKDLFQFNIPHNRRVYSKKTCIWLHNSLNSVLANGNPIRVHNNCIYEIVGYNIFYVKTPLDNSYNFGPFVTFNDALFALNNFYSSYSMYDKIIMTNMIKNINIK